MYWSEYLFVIKRTGMTRATNRDIRMIKLPNMSTNLSRLWLAGFVLVAAGLFCRADAADRSADEYIEMAREGMQVGEYLAAATNFRKAAEASDSVDIAQQATRIAFGFGFDDEALKSAKQ